jgi:prephenate dehydrogenase
VEVIVDGLNKDLSTLSVGIAGLGLIGGSLARRFAQTGVRTLAWNHHDTPYADARAAGIECVDSLEDLAMSGVDVLFLCTPLRAMEDMLDVIAPHIPPATTLSDVGSVKTRVHDAVVAAGLGRQYVGAHPMAGSEFSGFQSSSAALLDSALWAITFDDTTDYLRYLLMARIITDTLGNTFIGLDNATHDAAAATISHMPHVVATAMVNLLQDSPECNVAAALSAGSWRDMTRVALTDPDRTQAMVEENPANVAALVREMAQRLTDVADLLDDPDNHGLELTGFFRKADPYRRFKQAQRDGRPMDSDELTVTSRSWRHELVESARRGERITRVRGIRTFDVQWQHVDD